LDQEYGGLPAIQYAGYRKSKGRVQARLLVAQFAKNGGDAGELTEEPGAKVAPQAPLQTHSGQLHRHAVKKRNVSLDQPLYWDSQKALPPRILRPLLFALA
jgi:hypothetical protein